MRTESRLVVAKAGGWRGGESLLAGMWFLFGMMKVILELDSGDSCTAL